LLLFFDKRDFSTQLRFDSRIYLYRDSSIGFKLYEMYAIKGGPSLQPVLGNWSEETGISISSPFMWERRTNLFGIELRNAALSYAFFVSLEYNEEGKITGASGYFTDILSILGQKFNFTFVTITSADGKWGAPEADGSWNGLIGMLTRDEADVVTCGPTQTMERSAVSDMSIPLLPDIGKRFHHRQRLSLVIRLQIKAPITRAAKVVRQVCVATKFCCLQLIAEAVR
jgi:hypothetical protein